jgi:hypothetical protein
VGLGKLFSGAVRAPLLALLSLTACSGQGTDLESTASSGQAIQNYVEGVGFEFVRAITVNPTNGSPALTPTLEPTICTNRIGSWVVASRDNQNRYRTIYGFGPIGQYMTPWSIHSGNPSSPRLFNSRPACAMREDDATGKARFVLVGKSNDDKLYASTGTLPTPSESLPTPTVSSDWAAVSNTVYSGSAGPASPTLASHPGGDGGMVMVFISGSTVYAHHHALPYSGSSWLGRVAAPALPGGAIPIGTPAVAFVEGWAQLFHVVVRAQVAGQNRLYETYYGRTATGPKFCGILCGSMAPTWTQLPITRAIDSSPALEYSPRLGAETLYFRRGNDYVQTSGFVTSQQLGTLPIVNVYPNPLTFTGAPSAVAGFQFEMGSHLLVSTYTSAQNTTNIVFLETQNDDRLAP